MAKNKQKSIFLNYFKPSLYVENVSKINIASLKSSGIKLIICDLDNTLISFSERMPSKESIEFIKAIKLSEIEFVLFSNNIRSRVENFSKKAEVANYFWDCKKPLTSKMTYIQKKFNFNKDEIIMIGDQLITDIFFANRCYIKSILVTPLKRSSEGNKITNWFENIVLKNLEQKNILHEGFYTEGELGEKYEIL
ncbi:YqeG family HAD IIIA-type phosphatase [Spiroplasma endosymbiont of Othius punctulatus]|uniref:YqeG family HAD IIIA-type phosphatase n=1 Tax=Spiroplasma endosymbiont of Othius punctulatus TaxID=3066289 RepID=UPI0030CDD2F9